MSSAIWTQAITRGHDTQKFHGIVLFGAINSMCSQWFLHFVPIKIGQWPLSSSFMIDDKQHEHLCNSMHMFTSLQMFIFLRHQHHHFLHFNQTQNRDSHYHKHFIPGKSFVCHFSFGKTNRWLLMFYYYTFSLWIQRKIVEFGKHACKRFPSLTRTL